ncbi:hypothetical protein Vafri_22182 [Volvox africanus]|nr:hypothetical protein Vafri_22182 [Volvox africanus]
MFRAQEGLALQMERRLYDVPSCNGLLRGEVMLQALPSIVAAQVLNPRPGTAVLDMCAAPGGKTTLLATLMSDQGRLVALDRTATKVAEIRSLARDLGVRCVEAYQADATEAVVTEAAAAAAEQLTEAAAVAAVGDSKAVARMPPPPQATSSPSPPRPSTIASAAPLPTAPSSTRPLSVIAAGQLLGPPPYPAGTFDHILLDPPCSALGLRPRLLHSWNLPQLRAMAAYQRSLMHTAVRLLAPGGEMVYCTCTINPDENEANVAWALDRFSGSLRLLPAEPLVGLTGLTGADPETGSRWLSEQEAAMVQRFDPGQLFYERRSMAPTATIVGEDGGKGLQPHKDGQLRAARDNESNASDPAVLSPPPLPPCCWSLRAMGALPLPSSLPPSPPAGPMPPLPHQQVEGKELGSLSVDEEDSPWVDDVMGFFIARFQKVAQP